MSICRNRHTRKWIVHDFLPSEGFEPPPYLIENRCTSVMLQGLARAYSATRNKSSKYRRLYHLRCSRDSSMSPKSYSVRDTPLHRGQYKEYGYYWKRKTGYGGRFPISARDRSLSAITQPTTPSSFEDELNAVGEYYAPLANRYSFHIK